MRDEGWTLSDLDGELLARGMTLGDTDLDPSGHWLSIPRPEDCAEHLEKLKDGE